MAEETKNTTVTTNNDADNQQTETKPSGEQTETKTEDAKSVEEESAKVQLAAANAEIARLKNALSKSNSEAADYKKKFNATRTEQQKAEEAKQEAEEQQAAYVKELEDYKRKNEALKRYMNIQEMPAELAEKAAEAEIADDMETLTMIQKQFRDMTRKADKAEWQRSIPEVNRGTGNAPTMTKEEIFAMRDPVARQKAIAENMALFNQKN